YSFRKFAPEQNVEAGRTFQRRPPRHLKETSTIFRRELPVTFRDVQPDAGRCAIELVLCRRLGRNRCEKFPNPAAKIDGFPINIQFFVIKIDFHLSNQSRLRAGARARLRKVSQSLLHYSNAPVQSPSIFSNSTQRLL